MASVSVVAAVEVDKLVIRYGDRTAVAGVSFTAQAGQVTAVLGPNGAGKTSTIETLEGYRRPDDGRVRVCGLNPIADRGAFVHKVGVMLQDGGVYPSMRVGEAVELFCSYHANRKRPADLITLVGLTERTKGTWRQLSGGEQQRLKLALALAGDPEVVFLDEPTAGVDVQGRLGIREVIRSLAGDGVAVVLTTHELGEAERLADHLVVLDRGHLVGSGTLDELRAGGGPAEIHFTTTAGLDVSDLERDLGCSVTEVRRGEYIAQATLDPAVVGRLTGWLTTRSLPLIDLRGGRPSLEEVFLRLTDTKAPPDAPAAASGRRRRRP
jgi:ABC-2 type transport system ATP-binding protein